MSCPYSAADLVAASVDASTNIEIPAGSVGHDPLDQPLPDDLVECTHPYGYHYYVDRDLGLEKRQGVILVTNTDPRNGDSSTLYKLQDEALSRLTSNSVDLPSRSHLFIEPYLGQQGTDKGDAGYYLVDLSCQVIF